MDVGALRRAVAAAAGTVTAPQRLQSYGYVPDAGDPPFCYPADTDGNYHEDTQGSAGLVVTLRILTSRSEDRAGQELLDAYLASTSVPAAIEAAVSGATVSGFTGYLPIEVAAATYYGAEVTVVILA